MDICVLGSGIYGSYVVDSLQHNYPDAKITVFDVGNKEVKSEQEIGFLSSLKKSMYKGLTKGRYFGLGGASNKWGGQLLTFTKNDFAQPDKFMQGVIELNEKYKDKCFAKFNIQNKYPENRLTEDLFTKTGVWLSMFHRDFFYWFKIDKRDNVVVKSDCRVVKLISRDKKKIDSVIYLENGKEKEAVFDFYFLTSGAFESARVLLSSGFIAEDKVKFSDHLSQKMFKVKGSTIIGKEDFVGRMKGASLITKRIIGEVNNVSYYIHPVFNMKFPFFKVVKDVLFYHDFSIKKMGYYIKTTTKDLPNVLGFMWSVVFLRKIYVMNKEWFLYLDIENPNLESYVELSTELDKYGLPGLDVHYNLGEDAMSIYKKAQEKMIEYLDANNVNYEIVTQKIDMQTCEDIFHPYAMFMFESIEDYFSKWDNMLVVSTGVLSRSGGINPTGSVLPLIDEFVKNKLVFKS